MKQIVLSALSAFLLCQTSTYAQISVGVSDGPGAYPDAHLFNDGAGGLGPGEFMTQPEMRAFGPTGDENGPTAPFYTEPTYNYTGWFRPRAAGRTQAERCYAPDTFRPRGFGRLFARPANGMRVDYRPYALNNWNSQHGPAYYPIAEDPRCPHCDKQGCCLSGLFGSCGSCGGCNTCGNGDCDGGCDTGACDDGGCGLSGGRRAGWSEWITRAPRRTNLRQRLRPRARRRMARNGGCLDGSCGQNSCNACAQGMSLANNTACNSCGQNGCSSCGTQAPANSCGCQTQTQTQSQTQNASNGTGFIRHNATTEAQQMFNDRTAYEEAAAGVIN